MTYLAGRDASRPGQRTEQDAKRPCHIPTQSVRTRMCVKFPSTDYGLAKYKDGMMKIYLQEKIGNPEMFTGRKKELAFLLNWVEGIKKEVSQSRSLVSRRKTGKTAILQRLFNIVFDMNGQVIPFYYEVKEAKQWSVEFCLDFFLSFVYQYIAFRSRNLAYLSDDIMKNVPEAIEIAQKEGFDFLVRPIKAVQGFVEWESVDLFWTSVRDFPRGLARRGDMRVMQIIDEFQFLNRKIYRDKDMKILIDDFAQTYLSTAEYKNAPLLVAGSWVGWLLHDLLKMPARFILDELSNMPETEAAEMILNYSEILQTPVTPETVHLIAELSEGSPFYMASLIKSEFPDKDLTTHAGVLAALEYETLNKRGGIHTTWMEYTESAFDRINQKHAKNIVLYLSKHREREVGRKEIREKLVPNMDDYELEKKMKALIKTDIIQEGSSNFYYQGVQDNIFDKVFRSKYARDIQAFDPAEITDEYKAMFESIRCKYNRLSGEYNYFKGKYAEFIIIRKLARRAFRENDKFKSMLNNLPENFAFVKYKRVWSWSASPIHKADIQVDIFAVAQDEGYSLIGEVKNRKKRKFAKEEVLQFKAKANELMRLEKMDKALQCVFCRAGFTLEALDCLRENGMAWSDDARWMTE